jgi:hypothetical protein
MIDGSQTVPRFARAALLILHLRPHGRRVLLMLRCQFRWPRSHLDTTRSAVETHMPPPRLFPLTERL